MSQMEGEDLMRQVEVARGRLTLSQHSVASACGFSQGHYSRLTRGASVGRRSREKLQAWLWAQENKETTSNDVGLRLDELARTLVQQATELAGLAAIISERQGGSRKARAQVTQ
jgi:transcriptional regulator with XRE-family HTH domain